MKSTTTTGIKAIALGLLWAVAPASGFLLSSTLSPNYFSSRTIGTWTQEISSEESSAATASWEHAELFSRDLGSFEQVPNQSNRISIKKRTTHQVASSTQTMTSSSAPRDAFKAFCRQVLRHAIVSTLILKYCLPRVPLLNPFVLTIAMTLIARHHEITVGSHEW